MVLLDRIVLKTSIYGKRAASLVIVFLLIGEVGLLEFKATVRGWNINSTAYISVFPRTLQ